MSQKSKFTFLKETFGRFGQVLRYFFLPDQTDFFKNFQHNYFGSLFIQNVKLLDSVLIKNHKCSS